MSHEHKPGDVWRRKGDGPIEQRHIVVLYEIDDHEATYGESSSGSSCRASVCPREAWVRLTEQHYERLVPIGSENEKSGAIGSGVPVDPPAESLIAARRGLLALRRLLRLQLLPRRLQVDHWRLRSAALRRIAEERTEAEESEAK